MIFGRLNAAGLKVNVPKCSLVLKGIPYIGYVITREGIKPNQNKFEGIVDIGRPSTSTEAQAIVGMVQYYRDMWNRQSHILAFLTEAYSGPKGRKYYVNTL